MQQDDTETYAAPAAHGGRPDEARPMAPLQVRDRGRYQVIAEHGRGGIGRVLRATDREFGRDVALKELLIRTASSEVRFMREALITARLEHPNIVPVHEAGRWDDGTPFYAMKLVAGRPLKALIAEATTYPARLKLVERVLAVTDAIAYAHDRGIVHRDLKPSNIIVGDYGETIVIDWGLAKAVGDADAGTDAPSPSVSSDLTVAGAVLGTPAYMAPEQASGDEATARSDVYALGAIVLDVLRGGGPRPERTAAAGSGDTSLHGSAAEKVEAELPDVRADLRSVLLRAMATAPSDRYPSARAFGDDLRRFLAGATVDAHRYTARERAGRWLAAHHSVMAPPDPDGKQRDWRVYSVSLSPDDSELVTGQKYSIGFWEPWTGVLKRRVPMRTDGHQVWHSGDGTKLLTIIARNGDGRRARIFDAASAAEVLSVPVDTFEWLAWSPDGSVIALIDAAGKVDVWSTAPSRRIFSFKAGPAPTYLCLAISPDGSTLAARGDGELVLASLKTREVRRLPAPGESLMAVAFSPDSRRVAATTLQDAVRIWDVATGASGRRLEGLGKGFAAPVFSSDSAHIITIGGALQLWDIASTIRLASIDIQTGQNAVFARNSARALLLTAEGGVTVLGVPGDRWARPLPGHRGRVRGYIAADSSVIVTIDEGDGVGRLRRWTIDGRLLSTAAVRWNVTADIAVSTDGKRVAVVGSDDRPLVVDAETGSILTAVEGAPAGLRDVAFSPDGRFLATAGSSIDVWALPAGTATGVKIRAFKDAPYSSVSFSADGRRLVTGIDGWDGLVWDAVTGFLLQILSDGFAPDVRYSSDGRYILTSGSGPRFPTALFDAQTSRRVKALETDNTGAHAAALSPDGTIVATVNRFGAVRVLSAATGAPVRVIGAPSEQRILEHAVSAYSLDFSPDGRRLLATGDGYAMLWNMEVDMRTPDEVDAVVTAKSPWQLVDGRLVPRK